MYYSQFKLIFHLENRVFYLQVIRNEVNSYGGMRNKNIEASNQDTHGASPGHRKATLSTKINDKIKILSIIIACTSSILNGEVLQTTHTGPCCCFDLLWQFPPQFASGRVCTPVCQQFKWGTAHPGKFCPGGYQDKRNRRSSSHASKKVCHVVGKYWLQSRTVAKVDSRRRGSAGRNAQFELRSFCIKNTAACASEQKWRDLLDLMRCRLWRSTREPSKSSA
jgi:hypothetical protein